MSDMVEGLDAEQAALFFAAVGDVAALSEGDLFFPGVTSTERAQRDTGWFHMSGKYPDYADEITALGMALGDANQMRLAYTPERTEIDAVTDHFSHVRNPEAQRLLSNLLLARLRFPSLFVFDPRKDARQEAIGIAQAIGFQGGLADSRFTVVRSTDVVGAVLSKKLRPLHRHGQHNRRG